MDSKIFQSHSRKIGEKFSGFCIEMLRGQGWQIDGSVKVPGLGITVDQVARTKKGTKIFFEFNGSVNGSQPGMKRTSAVNQAVAKAFLLRHYEHTPFVVLTSHKPNIDSTGDKCIRVSKINGVIKDVLGVFNRKDVKALEHLLNNQ
jgi:hypothetical protein